MRWRVDECIAVGGMRSPVGKAPFARAQLVLHRRGADPSLMIVTHYVDGRFVEGRSISQEEWDGLVESAEAMRIVDPRPIRAASALWLFRSSYRDQRDALDDLLTRGAQIGDRQQGPAGTFALIVDELIGNPWRSDAATQAFDRAWTRAEQSAWQEALYCANLAFLLSLDMRPEQVALLSLVLSHTGDKTRSEGYLEMARNSRGATFYSDVQERQRKFQDQLLPAAAPMNQALQEPARSPRRRAVREEMAAERQRAMRGSLAAMLPEKRAA